MTSVTRMLRQERLRYAVKRETDRQNVDLEAEFIDGLVAYAMQNIDAAFSDEEARIEASERAERSLHPVIASLSGGAFVSFDDFISKTDKQAFPWSKSTRP